MNKKSGLIAFAAFSASVILAVVFLLQPPERLDAGETKPIAIGNKMPVAPLPQSDLSSELAPPVAVDELDISPPRQSEEGSDNLLTPDTVPPVSFPDEITVHVASDFRRGDHSNVLAGSVLRMGAEPGFTPRGAPPGQKFGIYVSPPKEASEAFDEIIAESEALIPKGSELAFEYRIRPAAGDWSVWQRIEPNQMSQPVALETPAIGWQYRLTFYANDPSLSPRVSSVAFVTRPATR